MSNDTFWPSVRVRMPAASTAVACTNTSLPPPSGAMKPKPLEVLKNFTVPIVIDLSCKDFPHSDMPGGTRLYGVAGKLVQPSRRALERRQGDSPGALHCNGP